MTSEEEAAVQACLTAFRLGELRDVHRFLDALRFLEFDFDKVMLVLNHCYQRSQLRVKEVERVLGQPIAQTIDYAPSQGTASLNRGVPLLTAYGNSGAAQDIRSLALKLVDRGSQQERPTQEARPVRAKEEKSRKQRRLFLRSPLPGRARG